SVCRIGRRAVKESITSLNEARQWICTVEEVEHVKDRKGSRGVHAKDGAAAPTGVVDVGRRPVELAVVTLNKPTLRVRRAGGKQEIGDCRHDAPRAEAEDPAEVALGPPRCPVEAVITALNEPGKGVVSIRFGRGEAMQAHQ